jgi:hypothetical protein
MEGSLPTLKGDLTSEELDPVTLRAGLKKTYLWIETRVRRDSKVNQFKR